MRPWFVIPIAGALAATAGLALANPGAAIGLGLMAAAIAAAVRSLAGDSPAAIVAAAIAAVLATATLLDAHEAELRQSIAIAAFAWTIAELARVQPNASPLVAMLPALIAGVLDVGFIALVPIAGARLVTAPWQRPRWVIAAPILGAIATIVAVVALARTTHLGTLWSGRAPHAIAPVALLARLPDALDPFVAVAALAGLVAIAGRGRYTQLALGASIVGALATDLRAGAVGPATIGVAALFAGLAVARLAAMIRIPSGQAVVAATVGLIAIAPPALGIAATVSS